MEPSRIVAITDLLPWRAELIEALRSDVYGMSFEAMQDGVQSGESIALEIDGLACAVLQLIDTEQGYRTLHTIALGGSGMERWLGEYLDCLQRLGKEQGAKYLTCLGRPGWKKMLREFGWNHVATAMGCKVGTT